MPFLHIPDCILKIAKVHNGNRPLGHYLNVRHRLQDIGLKAHIFAKSRLSQRNQQHNCRTLPAQTRIGIRQIGAGAFAI